MDPFFVVDEFEVILLQLCPAGMNKTFTAYWQEELMQLNQWVLRCTSVFKHIGKLSGCIQLRCK